MLIINFHFQVCQDETRSVLVSTPSEECDLEPVEECAMETVLVPRLVERPKCIKVIIEKAYLIIEESY